MAKPNYAFAKRQRDLAKKQKKEEKRLKKASGIPDEAQEGEGEAQASTELQSEEKPETP
jgi:hypothetical protein